MGYVRHLSAEEAALLGRAGAYIGRDKLVPNPTLIGRVLGDLMPDAREARQLCDSLLNGPDGSLLLTRLASGEAVALPTDGQGEAACLGQMLAALFGQPVQPGEPAPQPMPEPVREIRRNEWGTAPGAQPANREIRRSEAGAQVEIPSHPVEIDRRTPPAPAPAVTLAELPSATLEEISQGYPHKIVPGLLRVSTEGVMIFRRTVAGAAGVRAVGMLTAGLGMKSMLRRTTVAAEPTYLLPAQEILAVTRQFLPGVYDLMIRLRNGRRFRVRCDVMEAKRAEVESVAAAIEQLCNQQGGSR